ncbi:hypothetical protein PFISCL1PPCAC_25752 [Pristionchus fissidentatus]|uniref:Peptidase n=1 Tax=Pristionchus fissidentatus TaxID=1538716 RepID=A0AAV5WV49_9BILA|nr:hypothetical protein PFISCL1PPCAC_25752 [Pristionchus fissidentatus]
MRAPALLLVALAAVAAGKWFRGRPSGGFVNGPFRRLDSRADQTTQYPGQTISNFSQKFDHFDALDQRRWNQRAFYNPIHADRDKSSGQDIVFLMIGGEGREGAKWSGDDNVMIMQYAQTYGATVFDLEHRFFGDSRPINDMKTSSLRYLTTEQALADLAYFITVMNQEHKFKNPKWITFGGSYPGALCAQFRSKYPELTAGAVASSAPLWLSLDFYQYADVVESVLKQTPIENEKNLRCDELVRQAFDRMQQLSLTAAGRQELNQKLRLDPPFGDATTKADINNLFANLYDAHQGMIQYTYDGSSDKSKNYATAANLCRLYNQDKDLIDNVWDLLQYYNQYWNGVNITKFANSYDDMIKELQETDYDILGDGGNEGRGWLWLCCNEIGYLQTTDGDSIFGSTLPMNYFYDMCTDMFGDDINAPFIRDNNRAAQDFYGGVDDFDATNLCLPNGKFDPWSALGYYKADAARNIVPVVIEGAAHCSDMYPPYDNEPKALPAAREQIFAFLDSVIYDADHPKKSAGSFTLAVALVTIVARLL